MKVAFFHDHKFRRDEAGTYFSPGGLPYAVLARYARHFDEVLVVGRELPVPSDRGRMRLTQASGQRVTMRCLDGGSRFGLLASRRVRSHVHQVLDESDCAIIRLPSLVGVTAAREAIRLRKPWMAEVVACAWDALWNHGQLGGKLAAAPMFALTRYLVARAPWVTYVSQEFLQRRYPSTGCAIGCSDVAIEKPDAAVLARRLGRITSGAQGRTVMLGMVGSLDVDYKGHDTALKALKALRAGGIDARLRCLGGGNAARWQQFAKRLEIEPFVEFSGVLASGEPVLDWMDQLDVYLIPSRQEGLPRALVEAMSRGLPAIGARTGGIPELLPSYCLHSPGDANQLAAAVKAILSNASNLQRIARENFEVASGYAKKTLDARRDDFLGRFANAALTK